MPVVVKGLNQTMKSLRQIQPDLEKAMRKDIKAAVAPVIRTSQQLVPQAVGGLRNWTRHGKVESSAHFPTFNQAEIVHGIKPQIGKRKSNSKGFASVVRIANTTRAGAIYETAGRKNPQGQSWVGRTDWNNHKVSHSINPNAGAHFINSLPAMVGNGNKRGRIIWKAWNQDHGRVLANVVKITEATLNKTMESGV